jgi:ribonuclease T2
MLLVPLLLGLHHSPGKTGAPAGDYESYVLALEWQPSWSIDACPGGKQQDSELIRAMNSSVGAYARSHLSLHGLWPNYDPALHGGFEWPQFCNVSGQPGYPECQHDPSGPLCHPSAKAVSTFNMTGRWQAWALQYAFGDLASHEWPKHGSCTPWSKSEELQLQYWELQEASYRNVSSGAGAALVTQNVGRDVPYATLQAAFDADTGGHHTTLTCAAGCHFDQVWLGFQAAKGSLLPLVTPLHGVNTSGVGSCASCDAVHISAWVGCPAPSPPATKCMPSQHGPSCSRDADCLKVTGCVRCAHSGFCTEVPA